MYTVQRTMYSVSDIFPELQLVEQASCRSDLDDIQRQLHRAPKYVGFCGQNRKVMLTGSKGCEEEGDEQPEEEIENDDEAKRADDLVLPVNELFTGNDTVCYRCKVLCYSWYSQLCYCNLYFF